MTDKSTLEKIEAKTSLFARLINSTKTLVIAAVTLFFLVIAIVSGDGRAALCGVYYDIIGQSSEPWQSIVQQNSNAWLVVEDVLQRNRQLQTVTADKVETQKISSTHYRFRWLEGDTFKKMDAEQGSDGVWSVNALPDEQPGWCS